jgi:hypothetical protein
MVFAPSGRKTRKPGIVFREGMARCFVKNP